MKIVFREERSVSDGNNASIEVSGDPTFEEVAAEIHRAGKALDAWHEVAQRRAFLEDAKGALENIILHCSHSEPPPNSRMILEGILANMQVADGKKEEYRKRYAAARAMYAAGSASTPGAHKPFWEKE